MLNVLIENQEVDELIQKFINFKTFFKSWRSINASSFVSTCTYCLFHTKSISIFLTLTLNINKLIVSTFLFFLNIHCGVFLIQ